jgi:hypothetical protein
MKQKVQSADVTWLGENHLHGEASGPSKNVWNGITFPIGQPVRVSNPRMIAKAKGNRFYRVENETVETVEAAPEMEAEDHDDEDNHDGDLSKMKVGQLRWKADQLGINHDGMTKAELREAIAEATKESD